MEQEEEPLQERIEEKPNEENEEFRHEGIRNEKKVEAKEEDDDEPMCRICRGTEKPLHHPCKCKGSIKYVHEKCLKTWFRQHQSTVCELCHHKIKFKEKNVGGWGRSFKLMCYKLFVTMIQITLPICILGCIISLGWSWKAFFKVDQSFWSKLFPSAITVQNAYGSKVLSGIYTVAVGFIISIMLIICVSIAALFHESLKTHPEILEYWRVDGVQEDEPIDEQLRPQDHRIRLQRLLQQQREEEEEEEEEEQLQQDDGNMLYSSSDDEREEIRGDLVEEEEEEDGEQGDGLPREPFLDENNAQIDNNDDFDIWFPMDWNNQEPLQVYRMLKLIGNIIAICFTGHLFISLLVYLPYFIGRHHDYWYDGKEFVLLGKDMIKNENLRSFYYIIRGYAFQLISVLFYVAIMYAVSYCAPQFNFWKQIMPIVYYCYLFFKFVIASLAQFFIGPTLIGVSLHLVVGEFVGSKQTLKDIMGLAIESMGTFVLQNFVPGITAVFITGFTFNHLRNIVRKDVLWFITNSTDPNFEYIHMVNKTPPHRLLRSFILKQVMFVFLGFAIVRMPLKVLSMISPADMFPLNVSLVGFSYSFFLDSFIIYIVSHITSSRKLISFVIKSFMYVVCVGLSIFLGIDEYLFLDSILEHYHNTFINFESNSLLTRYFANPSFEHIDQGIRVDRNNEEAKEVSPVAYTVYLLFCWIFVCMALLLAYGMPLLVGHLFVRYIWSSTPTNHFTAPVYGQLVLTVVFSCIMYFIKLTTNSLTVMKTKLYDLYERVYGILCFTLVCYMYALYYGQLTYEQVFNLPDEYSRMSFVLPAVHFLLCGLFLRTESFPLVSDFHKCSTDFITNLIVGTPFRVEPMHRFILELAYLLAMPYLLTLGFMSVYGLLHLFLGYSYPSFLMLEFAFRFSPLLVFIFVYRLALFNFLYSLLEGFLKPFPAMDETTRLVNFEE